MYEADTEHEHRPARQVATDTQLDRWPALRTPDEAGVDEADERDEQADPGADRGLQLARGRLGIPLSQPGEDEHENDQPLEHHQTHRVRPGHLGRDSERDKRVQAEARWRSRTGSARRPP